MQKCRQLTISLLITCAFTRSIASAQSTNQDADFQWIDASTLTVEGKGWQDTKHFYDRLPRQAEGTVRAAVWGLSQDSAGLAVRFVTDATAIAARWTLRRDRLAMPHMPASGVSGLDLYIRDKGKWHWLGGGRPDKFPTDQKDLAKGLAPGQREYLLYLPLYNGLEGLKIGIPTNSNISSAPRRAPDFQPVVFYGTSIVQGGCAARPGMAYPAILGRRLDREQINLGFSGNAWSEPELAQLLAELNPSAYVLDPLPNMKEEWVAPRISHLVRTLRAAHPTTPIVLVENIAYADGDFVKLRRDRSTRANARLRETYESLRRGGDKRLFYVSADHLLGSDHEGTVDGTHPTDLGFLRMADAIEPALRRALKSQR
jgi:hypothetical protein